MHRTWDLTAFFAVLVVVSLAVTRAHSQFPAKKLCADISCSVPIAEAEALIGFHGGGGDDRIAFRKGATMKIFGVTDGSRNKFFDVEVEGKRGWANSIHIKELRKLANASVEVPVRNDGEAVPSPSPPVDGVPPEIAGSSSTSVDPLEELLRTPTDPSLLDSFLNPSPTTTGPDFATASISKPEIAENGPPSVLAGSLEPTPSLQAAPEVLSTAMPSSEERSSTKIELLGDKFWGEGDDYEEDDDGEKNGEATPESPTDVTDRTSEVNAASGSAAESDDFLHETGNSSLGTEPEAAEMEVVGKEDGTQVVKEEVQIHGDISSEPAVASSLLIEEAREKRETEFGVGPAVEPEVVPQHEVFDEPPPPTQPAEDSPKEHLGHAADGAGDNSVEKESIQLSSGSGVESTLVEEPLQLSSGASVDSSVLDVLDSSVEKDTSNELFQQPSSGTSDSNGNVVVEMELGATPADVHNDEAAPSRPEVTTDHSERFTTDTDSPAEEEHRDHIASESAQGLGRTTVPQQVDHSSIVSENVETTAVPPQIVRGPVVTEHVETTAVPPQAHPSHIAAEDVEGTAKPQQMNVEPSAAYRAEDAGRAAAPQHMDHGPAVAETVKMTASPEQRDQGSSVTENTVTTAASQEMDQGSTVAENTVSTAASQEMDQGSTVAENNVRTAASQEKDQGSTVTENSVTTAASREMDQGSTVTENSATMAASREMDQGSIVTENSVTSAASQGMHPGHETAENIEETAAPQQLSDAPSKNPSQSGEEDGTAPPPTPSPHFYYSTRNTLEAKPEPVDEGSNLDEVEPVKGSLDTLEAEFVADHPLETEVDSEDPLLTASEESHAEVARDYTAEIPFDSGIPDDGPKVSGAFEEIVDAFRQLFDNFLDAVLPIIQYISTALQPLWPHIHAVIPPKYLNQATMLTVIAALYTVLTSFLYIVVRFVFRNKRVERDLIITANQVSNLVSLRDALKEENLNLTEELDKERQMHIQAGSRISTLEIDLDLTKKNLREVEKRLKAELEEKEGLQRELMETTETLETTQSLLNDSLLVKQGKFTEDDDALQMQFETLEKMLNDQTAKVTSLKADLNYTKEENAKLKEQYLETERNMVDREEELAKLREGHEFLLKRTHERDENLEALKLALGLEDEGPESGENRIVSSFRAILNGDGDASSELSNLFDVGRAKRQIRELEKENEELQVKVTELEVLREHVLTKDGELERLREKEKELQFVETFYRKKEEELLSEISRLKQREDRFLSQEKEGRTLADYIQTLEDKLRLIESDKQNSDVRGKEKVIELEKELCDCKFRLQQTQRRLEGVITENNELRKRVGLRHSNAKASPSGSIGDGVDGLMPFAPDLVPPMLPPGMLPPLMRGPGGPMPPPMMGPRPPLPPGMPGGPPPPLADRLPPLGDQGRPEPPPGPPGMPPFQLPPRPPFFPGPPGMVPPPPHLMGRPGSPGRGSEGGNGGRRSRNRSPSPGWSDRSAPARGFYRSSLRRRSRSISPNSRGSLRSPPYRPNMGPMDFPDDRSIGSNGGRDREGGRGSVPPSQPRRLDPRGGRGGRYSESPSPPPPPYYDDPPSRGSRGRRDGHEDERRRNGRSPNAYV